MVLGETDNQKQIWMISVFVVGQEVDAWVSKLHSMKKETGKRGSYRPFFPTNVARYPWPCVSSTVSVISHSWKMDCRPATVESESTEDTEREKESSEKAGSRPGKLAAVEWKAPFLT